MADKNEKIREMLTLVAIFCYNASNNIHKTNNNHKVHVLVTKKRKKKEKSLLFIQKWALEKN